MAFLIFKGVKLIWFVDDGAEYVTMLSIVMKFDITFEWHNVAFWVLKEQLLLPLNEHRNTWLSEDLQEGIVFLGYQLGHHHIDGLPSSIKLFGRVAQHVAQLSIGVNDFSKFTEGASDEQETRFVHILVELLFVIVILQSFIHGLYLLHFQHVFSVLIVTV